MENIYMKSSIFYLACGLFALCQSSLFSAKIAYVSNPFTKQISVIDLANNEVTDLIPTTTSPKNIVLHPDGKTAYLSNTRGRSIEILDMETNTIVSMINVGAPTDCLTISPDGKTLYAPSSRFHRLHIIDTESGNISKSLDIDGGPIAVAVTSDHQRAYIACFESNEVLVLDPAEKTLLDIKIDVGAAPKDLVVVGEGLSERLFVANSASDTVSVVSIEDAAVVETLSLSPGSEPSALVALSDGSKVYAVNTKGETVVSIDTETSALGGYISVGSKPSSATLSLDEAKLYVTNLLDAENPISVIDLANETVTSITMKEGYGSNSLAITELATPKTP